MVLPEIKGIELSLKKIQHIIYTDLLYIYIFCHIHIREKNETSFRPHHYSLKIGSVGTFQLLAQLQLTQGIPVAFFYTVRNC